MNLIKTPLAIASFMAAAMLAPSLAQAEGLSFNISAVSLYKSNGVDQDSPVRNKHSQPAIQGGVDYAFGSGFYVGNWNSTGRFDNADVEIDLYGGYRGEISKDLSFDVGYVRYVYPDQADWNGNELYGSLSYGIFTAKLTRGTSGSIDEHSRLSLSVAQPLTDVLKLNAGVGFRNTANENSGANDYSLGVSYDFGNDLGASATLSGAETSKVGDAGKARLVLGISKSF